MSFLWVSFFLLYLGRSGGGGGGGGGGCNHSQTEASFSKKSASTKLSLTQRGENKKVVNFEYHIPVLKCSILIYMSDKSN